LVGRRLLHDEGEGRGSGDKAGHDKARAKETIKAHLKFSPNSQRYHASLSAARHPGARSQTAAIGLLYAMAAATSAGKMSKMC
jgi:hypothetical protein